MHIQSNMRSGVCVCVCVFTAFLMGFGCRGVPRQRSLQSLQLHRPQLFGLNQEFLLPQNTAAAAVRRVVNGIVIDQVILSIWHIHIWYRRVIAFSIYNIYHLDQHAKVVFSDLSPSVQASISIPLHAITFHSIPFHSIIFHSVPFHSLYTSYSKLKAFRLSSLLD